MAMCFIMSGVSGSGKSTAADKLAQRFSNNSVSIFSLDTCRVKLFSDVFGRNGSYAEAFDYANQNQDSFNSLVNSEWAKSLKNEVVIVDNTNLSRKSRARWCADADAKRFTIWGINVYAPLQVVLDRQKTRGDKSVPENVVRDMFFRQQGFMVGDEVHFALAINGLSSSPTLQGSLHFT